jgi:hypothetical protein
MGRWLHTDAPADVKEYGFSGAMNASSTFNKSGETVNLTAPTLDIEWVYHPPYRLSYYSQDYVSENLTLNELMPEHLWLDVPDEGPRSLSYSNPYTSSNPYTYSNPYTSSNPAKYTLPGTNSILSIKDINRMGNCQQTAKYRWGFSFLLLFIVLILFIVWMLGTYVLWLDASLNSRLDIVKRDMGIYRATLDISSLIRNDLGKEVDALTPNSVLKKRIREGKTGGRIDFRSVNDVPLPHTRFTKFQIWARAGGKARWTPRVALVFLLILLIVPSVYSTLTLMLAPKLVIVFLILPFSILTLINILILGNGKQRASSRKKSQDQNDRQGPLHPRTDTGPSPSGSELCLSQITASNQPEDGHESRSDHAQDASKAASSISVEIT